MKRFNPDKELKKAQKKGIYNPRNKMFTIVLAVVLVVFISSSFAWFTSTSGSLGAFSGKANKKLTISVVATNGSVSTSSKTVNYKATTTFTVTPNSGYVYDSVSCTNNQTATFKNNTLTLDAPTSDTTCTLSFIQLSNVLATRILQLNSPKTTAPTSEAFRYGEPSQRKGVSGKIYTKYEDEWTGSITSSSNKAVASSYTFNSTTGYFTLSGTKATSVSYGSGYVGYYTCGSNPIGTDTSNSTTNCASLLRIETISGTNLTKATRITSAFSTSGSGLFSIADGDGTSYYYRGIVNNNYVSFANKLWRVVRINGDGSIRLVLDGNAGTSAFNNHIDGVSSNIGKYAVSFTYNNLNNTNNEVYCNSSSPCTIDYDSANNTFVSTQDSQSIHFTSSAMKSFLENWYVTNLSSYNDSVTLGSYCNDMSTSNTSGTYYYGSRTRLYSTFTPNPILTCNDISINSGGTYKLKIGLLTADEVMLAGYGNYDGSYNYTNHNNYMYYDGIFSTMSPSYSSSSKAELFRADYGDVHNVYFYDISGGYESALDVRPVINLKADVQVTSGDGTQSNPYVIQ